jgi:spore coat polysaccharide biosynthesis predicted glycosyltransferase SpsG
MNNMAIILAWTSASAPKMIDFDDYHLPEDDNHHSHCRGNLKSYMIDFDDKTKASLENGTVAINAY